MKKIFGLTAAFLVFQLLASGAVGATGYHIVKTLHVSDNGNTWDFQTIDTVGRRLYASHFSEVLVVNIDTGKLVGTIPAGDGVHGVAIARDLNRGFVTVGHSSTVLIFDLKDLNKIDEVKVGENPDAILYDPLTHRVFSFNGDSQDATVLDAATGKVDGTINIGGKPEFALADGKGSVYLDIVDKNLVLKINSRSLKIENRWPTAPCERPTSMAIDLAHKRLFVGCRNLMLVVLDAGNGQVVANAKIGDDVDTTAFDPATGLIFSSTGDGVVTIIHEDSSDKYSAAEIVKTHPGSKTMAFDIKTHQLFVPSGDVKFLPPAAPGGRPKKTISPGTHSILVLGK
jgi:DNA-binding beta-propeller fold protein YncE